MAVSEATGDIVQVTEGGYTGMLCLADRSMNLYFLRVPEVRPADVPGVPASATGEKKKGRAQIVRVDLGWVFADSAAGAMKDPSEYQHVCGIVPPDYGGRGRCRPRSNGGLRLFPRRRRGGGARHCRPATKSPRPTDRGTWAPARRLASMNLKTGEVKFIVDRAVPDRPRADQSVGARRDRLLLGNRRQGAPAHLDRHGRRHRPASPLSGGALRLGHARGRHHRDEVAIAIMGHRTGRRERRWGIAGTREHPTGLGIVNLRTREMRIVGQTPSGSGALACQRIGRWPLGGRRRFFAQPLSDRPPHRRDDHAVRPATSRRRRTIRTRRSTPTARRSRSSPRCCRRTTAR